MERPEEWKADRRRLWAAGWGLGLKGEVWRGVAIRIGKQGSAAEAKYKKQTAGCPEIKISQ